ncbi:MAG: FtsX-like permease family protein [Thermoplasmata archaeon]|nr:MAG: FtsX-like permease family protein [Thermoplasmata archaeon]
MVSAIVKKSFRDLSKRKARTFFTILTIALGVMGISLFAVTPLADESALKEMENANMSNVRIRVTDVNLTQTNLQALEDIDNVNLIETRTIILTKVKIGERWNNAILIGVSNYINQKVDKIFKISGDYPDDFETLSEQTNTINGIHEWKKEDDIIVKDSTGSDRIIKITGEGRSLTHSSATLEGFAVFYTTLGTVQNLGNLTGYNTLSFDLEMTEDQEMETTIEEIRSYLTNNTSVVAFADLPETRSEDEWFGSEFLQQLMSFMSILTFLALFCSIFLISNTMNTIISEQRKEIAQLKAIGATNFQVFKSYLTTSLIMGIIGAVLGSIMGIFISFYVLITLGRPFGFETSFMVHYPTVLISLVVGLVVVIGASLPALVRSTKVLVREGLESHGISGKYGKGALDRLLLRMKGMPRTVQMGLRNAARKKGRSATTTIQVAMAVGVFLGLVTFGYSLQIAVSGAWSDRSWDIRIISQGGGENQLYEDDTFIIDNIEGVKLVEPYLTTFAQINERPIEIWGYNYNTKMWDYEKTTNPSPSRWISQQDQENNSRVLVIGEALAEFEDLDVGDKVKLMTATGEFEFTIIGLQSSLMDNGQAVCAPLSTLQDVLRINDTVSGFLIHTESSDQNEIDKVSTRIEETLLAKGYVVNNQIHYVLEELNQAQNQGIMDLFFIVSLLVIFISMIGLMSTLTMNVIDRTKEIGMMRCIGSKSKNIWTMFCVEGVFLSIIGWVIGIPVGYILSYILTEMVADAMKLQMVLYFPYQYILYSFLIALIGTILIIQAPLLRATKLKPGDALRYE